jgi:hypothetical protein
MRPELAPLAVFSALALWSPPAEAFPWMIHHTYTGCAQCHVDPSGGGVLTEYGRAQGDILLRSHFGDVDENPGPVKDFLFGAVHLPKNLQLQGDVRGLLIPDPANMQVILMQSDLRAAVEGGPITASASLGVVSKGASAAQITGGTGWNLVAREYWIGANVGKSTMVRVGRMNLPFGLRTEDHILDVRQVTRTDSNAAQQTGVSVFYNSKRFRAEIMGIAGNFQVGPDAFRERGYSLYAAYAPKKNLEIGVSSLLSASKDDIVTLAPRTRLAEGLFARWAPVPALAVLAEGDVLLDDQNGSSLTGFASSAILDYEPVQGLHVQGIGEQCDDNFSDAKRSSLTGGAAVQWFFLPHADLRLDAGYGTVYCTPGVAGSPFGLVQAHLYL